MCEVLSLVCSKLEDLKITT